MTELLESYRITTFVPAAAADAFARAVGPHIPAFIGGYDCVSWQSAAGTERYRPTTDEGAGGDAEDHDNGGIRAQASVRFEFSVPRDDQALKDLIDNILIPHHPWQEPVILVTADRIVKHGRGV